jgi:glycosyltransferase involved in cell wall biosynthesis
MDIDFIIPHEADYQIDFMKVNPKVSFDKKRSRDVSKFDVYDSRHSTTSSVAFDTLQNTYIDNVLRLVDEQEYDVIHAHEWLTLRAAIAAKQRSGLPLLVHVHATEYDRAGGAYGNPLVRDIEYYGFRMADKIIAISNHIKDIIIREYDVDPSKIVVVHNSIDIDPVTMIEKQSFYPYLELMKSRGYKVILNAGRHTLQKGLTFMLEAARMVVEKEPKTIFLFAGGGDHMYQELIQLSADLGLSQNVIFTGRLNGTGKEWRDAFRIADLFVMPSVSEPFGIAALEAIAYDCPVLVSKQSGVSEAVRNILTVDFWDVHEMANKMLAVCRSSDLQQDLRTHASQEFANGGWSASADKIIHLYHHESRVAV